MKSKRGDTSETGKTQGQVVVVLRGVLDVVDGFQWRGGAGERRVAGHLAGAELSRDLAHRADLPKDQ